MRIVSEVAAGGSAPGTGDTGAPTATITILGPARGYRARTPPHPAGTAVIYKGLGVRVEMARHFVQ